jgi:hypothetical protein
MFSAISKALEGMMDAPADLAKNLGAKSNNILVDATCGLAGSAYRLAAQVALQPLNAATTSLGAFFGSAFENLEKSLDSKGWRHATAAGLELRDLAGKLKEMGIEPTPGELQKLYLARQSEAFKSGDLQTALHEGRKMAIESYTEMKLKSNILEYMEDPSFPLGNVSEEDIKSLYNQVEISYTIDAEGKMKTEIVGPPIIKSIMEGKNSEDLQQVLADGPNGEKVVQWRFKDTDTFLSEQGRVKLRSMIQGAHLSASTALEYKGDDITNAVAWREKWSPSEAERFVKILKSEIGTDKLIRTNNQATWDLLEEFFGTLAKHGRG